MFKKIFASLASLCLVVVITSCSEPQRANFNVIPIPQEVVELQSEGFTLNASTVICYPADDIDMKRNAEFLSQYIEQLTGMKLACSNVAKDENVILLSQGLENSNEEAYRMVVSPQSITIQGASAAGTFYGIQTLRKSLPLSSQGGIIVPAVEINDAPRFAYRGSHLDVSRNFVPTDSLMRYIDILALHNINRFHWHLSDDQGWRIEIKKYPKLTEVGAYRPETVIGKNTGKYDGKPHEGFYTQDEIRKVIAYAAERYITIIPEIDMPGHMQAALAAYPHLGCTGGPYEVWKMWGVSEEVLCAGNDETMQFVKDVLTEVVELFPSEYIHVGGDECPKVRWESCPKCQARIKNEGLYADGKFTAEERLQSYVIRTAEQHLNSMGRQMIGWDEVLEGGLAPNATVMSWRGVEGGIEAARQRHDVIMTPTSYLYFDYYQTENRENEPFAIGGYVPVHTVYNYEPVPVVLTPEEAKHIIGVQANLWTEYITTFSHLEYMLLPRMAALSEIQWSQPEKKNYDNFTQRLPHLIDVYKKLGHNYATHIFDISAHCFIDTTHNCIQVNLTTIDNAPIYYTLDGSEPTASSLRYEDGITIETSSTLKAVTIRNGEKGRVLSEDFVFNKATGHGIEVLSDINAQYAFKGGITLVDGLQGNDTNYKTGRWIGFFRSDMDVVIDLSTEKEVSSVGFNTCVEKGSWIFDTRGVVISTSCDGENFTVVHEVLLPAMTEEQPNEIYNHKYTFDPVKARYVRLTALTEHSIPQWHQGKGHQGFLFVDEIMID